MPRIKGVIANKIKDKKNYKSKSIIILQSVTSYFLKNKNNYLSFSNIINNKNKITVNFINWFITVHCENNIVFINDKLIYSSFKTANKYYSKKYFNPLRKVDNIKVMINNIELETSVCQLNFFKWAYTNGIVEYVHKNYLKLLDEYI